MSRCPDTRGFRHRRIRLRKSDFKEIENLRLYFVGDFIMSIQLIKESLSYG